MEERDDQDNNKPKDETERNDNLKLLDLSKIIIPFQAFAIIEKKIAENVAPMIKKVMEIQQSFQPIFERVGRFAASIDWEKLQDAIRQRLQHYEELMSRYDKECWAIDPDMLDALEDGEYDVTGIERYVEDHLNDYIVFFQEDQLYVKHNSLIREAYELYKREYYMHCAFSLLAIFEDILNRALVSMNLVRI